MEWRPRTAARMGLRTECILARGTARSRGVDDPPLRDLNDVIISSGPRSLSSSGTGPGDPSPRRGDDPMGSNPRGGSSSTVPTRGQPTAGSTSVRPTRRYRRFVACWECPNVARTSRGPPLRDAHTSRIRPTRRACPQPCTQPTDGSDGSDGMARLGRKIGVPRFESKRRERRDQRGPNGEPGALVPRWCRPDRPGEPSSCRDRALRLRSQPGEARKRGHSGEPIASVFGVPRCPIKHMS